MLKRSSYSLDISEAEVGDQFFIIENHRYSSDPLGIRHYEVIKVGKRDVICKNVGIVGYGSSSELRLNKNHANLHNAVLPDSPQIPEAITFIKLHNKRMKVEKLMDRRAIDQMPEALCDQIIAFLNSLSEKRD